VIGAWFTDDSPAVTSPSSGMREPDFTATVAPTPTSATGTSRNSLPSLSSAVSGVSCISAFTAFRARARLNASSNSESANRKVTAAPSDHC
jgi:hypothetical protein